MILKRDTLKLLMTAGLAVSLCACSSAGAGTPEPEKTSDIDYMVLVNKLHKLPDDWEDKLETVHMTNSMGDDVEVEAQAYAPERTIHVYVP